MKKDEFLAIMAYIVITLAFVFIIILIDLADGYMSEVTAKSIGSTLGFLLIGGVVFAAKKIWNFVLKPSNKKNKHLETILHNGFSQYGIDCMTQLYEIANNDKIANEWLESNRKERELLNQDVQEYKELDNKSNVVFYLRYYKNKGYDVNLIFTTIKSKYKLKK